MSWVLDDPRSWTFLEKLRILLPRSLFVLPFTFFSATRGGEDSGVESLNYLTRTCQPWYSIRQNDNKGRVQQGERMLEMAKLLCTTNLIGIRNWVASMIMLLRVLRPILLPNI